MSIFASILRSVYKLSGAKKAFALPEDALRKEIEKQNRHRGVFTPTDRKAYYETIAVNGFFGDLVQRGFLKAVSKKFRISSLNDPIIQEMIPSGHVFTPLRLNNNVNIDNDVVIAFFLLLFNANYTLLYKNIS